MASKIIIGQHKTLLDNDGKPLRQEFSELAWLTKWLPSLEWIYVGEKEQVNSLMNTEVQQTPVKKKKSCCGGRKK